jgi:type II secretory pathway pseudopilin PulG
MKKNINKKEGGYTIVELLVGVGLFLTATSVIVGIFIQGVRSQKFLNSLLEVQSNSSLMVEQIMREIRLGFYFKVIPSVGDYCGGLNPAMSQNLEFTRFVRKERIQTKYIWDDQTKNIIRKVQKMDIAGNPIGEEQTTQLNASSVVVNKLCFLLNNAEENPRQKPWRITTSFNVGSTNMQLENKTMDFQTTIAARIMPFEVPIQPTP